MMFQLRLRATHNKEKAVSKGFTLIEIIIAVVIVGVLATLALPRIASQVETGNAAEALVYAGVLKNAALVCYDASANMANCNSPALLSVNPPNSPRFNYTYLNGGADEFRLLAVSQKVPTNCIKMSVSGSSGQVGMTGYGELYKVVIRSTAIPANGAGANCAGY